MNPPPPESPPQSESPLVRLWDQLWVHGSAEGIKDYVTDPYVRHSAAGTEVMTATDYAANVLSICRHIRGTGVVFDYLDQSDTMIHARFTLHGISVTTGDAFSVGWIGQYRLVDGRIAEAWTLRQTDFSWDE